MGTILDFGRKVVFRLLRLLCITFILAGAGIIAWGIVEQNDTSSFSYMAMALVAVGVSLIMATLLWTGNKMGDSFESFAFDVAILSFLGSSIVFWQAPHAQPYAVLIAVGGAVSLLFCLMVAVKLPPNTEQKDPLKEPMPESEPIQEPPTRPPIELTEPASKSPSEELSKSLSEPAEMRPGVPADSLPLPKEETPAWRLAEEKDGGARAAEAASAFAEEAAAGLEAAEAEIVDTEVVDVEDLEVEASPIPEPVSPFPEVREPTSGAPVDQALPRVRPPTGTEKGLPAQPKPVSPRNFP